MTDQQKRLTHEMQAALELPAWNDSISAIKALVSTAFHKVDRRIEITDTGYFNHSFVPDFTLRWPRDDRGRDVFLRLDSTAQFISNDLKYIRNDQPILVGLGDDISEDKGDWVAPEAARANVLVTDTAALDELGNTSEAEFSRVVPASVIRGGRGVIGDATASSLLSSGLRFFNGARSHTTSVVSESAKVIQEHLNAEESGVVTNFGRIVWEATGGPPGQFPILTTLEGIDDDALRFLLEEGPTSDIGFWRSVGRSVTLERLVHLGLRRPVNLRSLLASNLDRMFARIVLIKYQERTLDQTEIYWAMARESLELRGDGFSAFFAARREDIPFQPDTSGGISLTELRDRTIGLRVQSVTVSTGDGKTVTVESESGFDLQSDETLTALAARGVSMVERIGILLNGKHLECQLDQRIASGRTNAQFELRELIGTALPVIWPLSEVDSAEISDLLSWADRSTARDTLFSEDWLNPDSNTD